MDTPCQVIILAAGKGTRMKSGLPKVLHPMGGRPLLHHVLEAATHLNPSQIIVVTAADTPQVEQSVKKFSSSIPIITSHQTEQLGTGHAVRCALPHCENFKGDTIILFGDAPLITGATLERLANERERRLPAPAIVILTMRPSDPHQYYGRVVLNTMGNVIKIVEYQDANPSERALNLCYSGIMAIDTAILPTLLNQITNNNSKGEYYLTDIIAKANQTGLACGMMETDPQEVIGINDRQQLSEVEALYQERRRQQVMEHGVTLVAPSTVFLSYDTAFEADVVVHPFVRFGPGVKVAQGTEIRSFCDLEGATIGARTTIGPFARIRPTSEIGDEAKVGNFVEIKQSILAKGSKANHLSYIGDTRVGENANIGAGTITCNYDGITKHLTEIGAEAFIGSNTALVAPVKVGVGAIIGAGSTITTDVPDQALALSRIEQTCVEGGATKIRTKKASQTKA